MSTTFNKDEERGDVKNDTKSNSVPDVEKQEVNIRPSDLVERALGSGGVLGQILEGAKAIGL
jgi:hypothetical protein